MNKRRVLFLCTHDSARSQMAEGFLRAMAAIRAMAERGVDISTHTSKIYDSLMTQRWDYLITVCDDANERCPFVPGAVQRLHWSFEDPSRAPGSDEARLMAFRRIRDAIEKRLAEWVEMV